VVGNCVILLMMACGILIPPYVVAKASHKIKMKNISAVNDSRDPIDETTFHIIKASG